MSSAQNFIVKPIAIPDFAYSRSAVAQVVNESISFSITAPTTIRTLSSYNFNNVESLTGLIFTPNFSGVRGCGNDTTQLIPANVTTRNDIPPGSYQLIAVAPWTNVDCVINIMSQIRQVGVAAAMFYHPDGRSDLPPGPTDPSWNLNDGGAWRGFGSYPIFAIPDSVGREILRQSSLYSGNMTTAPFSENLTALYNVHDYIRVFGKIELSSAINIPSLWIFLIIVLAVLLCVVLTTSFVMHLLQRRHRTQLRRRVANGEVDLETLGIKRLNVPQHILDTMPSYVYKPVDDSNKAFPGRSTLTQPTCAICLDDFVEAESTVRELPCGHIFHPTCIDPFLRENSSLCPLCKKSALPKGCCPIEITNIMVRRERLIRRLRDQAILIQQAEAGELSRRGRINLARHQANARFLEFYWPSAPAPNQPSRGPNGGSAELQRRRSGPIAPALLVPAEIHEQGPEAVRVWRLDQLAQEREQAFQRQGNEVERIEQRVPKWKKILNRVFPFMH